jgi:biotin transport system substrate-specific component
MGDRMPSNVTARALAPSLLWGSASRTLQEVLLVLAGTAILAVAAKVKVPFYPVPMTLQTLAVMLIAATYGTRLAVTTMIAYLAEGMLGLPVFAGAAIPSPVYFLGPTGGYLVAYPLAALIVGYAADRGWGRSIPKLLAAMAVADIVVFALGFAWLAAFAHMASGATGIGAAKAFAGGVAPFVLGDLLKIVLAALAVPAGWGLVGREPG